MTRAAAFAVLLAGCSSGFADTKPSEPPPSKRFEHDMMVRFHMHQNFDLLRAIERLLIKGKLDEARTFAAAIASAPDEPSHGPWATYKVTIRDRAAAVAKATDVGDALRKTASIGAACGNCHDDHVVKLALDSVPTLPPDSPTLDARMARHRWAVDRLWEGVVGNSDQAWRAGLDVLAVTPFEEPASRAGIARQLQRQADIARRPPPGKLVDRATSYGEILTTCASCHTAKR
jgi:cytochrome c553